MSRQGVLDGLEAIITGSSSGIGRAIAELLLRQGASVVGIARDHAIFTRSIRVTSLVDYRSADIILGWYDHVILLFCLCT